MSGFLYFLEGASHGDVISGDVVHGEGLAAFGLAGVLRDVRRYPDDFTVCDVQSGPAFAGGVILYARPTATEDNARVMWKPEEQTWRQATLYGERVRVGLWNDSPPGPEDLRRASSHLVHGHELKDDRNRLWTCPIARSTFDAFGTLPKYYRFGESGDSRGSVKPAFRDLWDTAGQVYDYFHHREWRMAVRDDPALEDEEPTRPPSLSPSWLRLQALNALECNYRIGPEELNLLDDAGLNFFDDQLAEAIAYALINFEVVSEFKKKDSGEDSPAARGSCDLPTEDITPATSGATAN